MKILIAIPYFPYPLNAGGSQATFHMINYLRNFVNITLICPYAEEDDLKALKKLWPNVTIEISYAFPPDHGVNSNFKRFLERLFVTIKTILKTLIWGKTGKKWNGPMEKCNFIREANMRLYFPDFTMKDAPFVNKFQELVNRENFDIVQVEFMPCIALIHCIPSKSIKIFVHHELSFIVMEREIRTLENPGSYERYLLNHFKDIELSLLNKYDRVLVLSDKDKIHLINNGFPQEKISISTFAVPVHSIIKSAKTDISFQNKIIFLGSEHHMPNLDAVYWFVKDVLPLLLRDMPDLKLYVIGLWRSEVIDLFTDFPNVIFTGFVKNLDEYLDGAVMIVPLRIGSGIRTKIIDAAMWKVPLITTSIGLEGIPFEDEKECLIADRPEDFPQKFKMLKHPGYINNLTSNAYEKVREWNSVERCGEIRKQIYESVLSEGYTVSNN